MADPGPVAGEEIRDRVHRGAVEFKLVLQIACPGDKLDETSIAWPKDRRIAELGTISITKAVTDNDAAQKQLLFLPNALPAGIEPEDPMINLRSAVYPVSYERR